ncbi:putative integral membrane protein (TIGR02587 family) [Prosthecobacter fusiformis]|uniref:Putative integral membrane protein (TIGR02587 family) n=1 Tax=Prosthecobacter fusiformis TaxID=48464 RepID=A0A4R7RJK8_9BACT|nr:TIGR02587 family membrane protein [Prosthecobacter fusiformis]TDU64347.1 putative integral membrane protein (TIGR02587 family) [Prosthecobacter fusiformis]
MSKPAAQMNRTPLIQRSNKDFFIGLSRAFGGALVFGLPLLMTMEMWSMGSTAEEGRLALLFLMSIPLLVGLSHYAGFEETFCMLDDVVDTFVALAVGFVTSGGILWMLGVIGPQTAADDLIAKIAIQAVPGSIGALLAASQFGTKEEEEEEKQRFTRYDGELFLMAVGAIFFAFNLAPTDEMLAIAQQMGLAQVLGLLVLSLAVMHAFVYAVKFSGTPDTPESTPQWSLFLRFTIPGYAIALLMSLYILWTFGRMDGASLQTGLATTVVLAFPAAIGAAAARLVI